MMRRVMMYQGIPPYPCIERLHHLQTMKAYTKLENSALIIGMIDRYRATVQTVCYIVQFVVRYLSTR